MKNRPILSSIIIVLILLALLILRLLRVGMAEPCIIVKAITDNRGLISVVYVQDKDTMALDYLTVSQLDSLITVGR